MSENTNAEMLEFYGKALLERVKEELPGSYVEQTGGGTATLMFFKGTGIPGEIEEGEVVIAGGPGSYNWNKPDESIFRSGEFAFGRDAYDSDGNEFPDDAESSWMDPEDPDLDAVAQRIIAKYREYNPEVVPADPDGSVASALPGNPFAAAVDTCSAVVSQYSHQETKVENVQMAQAINALMVVAFELRTTNMISATAKGYIDTGGIAQKIAQRMGYSTNNPA